MKNIAIVTFIFCLFFDFGVSASAIYPKNKGKKVAKSEIHYIKKAPKAVFIDHLPRKARKSRHNNNVYHYYKGQFFMPNKNQYLLVPPPPGLKVKNVPDNYERDVHQGQAVYYANGVFYEKVIRGKGFRVIKGPVGIKVSSLPARYQKATINGQVCFIYLGAIFIDASIRTKTLYELFGFVEE